MRDSTVGLVCFGVVCAIGFALGVAGGFVLWADPEGISYDVYKQTYRGESVYVKTFGNWTDAVDYVDSHVVLKDDYRQSIWYYIVVCDDWCRVVY